MIYTYFYAVNSNQSISLINRFTNGFGNVCIHLLLVISFKTSTFVLLLYILNGDIITFRDLMFDCRHHRECLSKIFDYLHAFIINDKKR